jgi:hypothetical protein
MGNAFIQSDYYLYESYCCRMYKRITNYLQAELYKHNDCTNVIDLQTQCL